MFLDRLKAEVKLDFKQAEAKADQFIATLNPDIKTFVQKANAITNEMQAALSSPEGIVVEKIVDTAFPEGGEIATAIANTITGAAPDLKVLQGMGSTNSIEAILQRAGSEMTSILHGGKKPLTFYIQAFQNIAFGTPAPTPTPES